jgi:hypothetical protein
LFFGRAGSLLVDTGVYQRFCSVRNLSGIPDSQAVTKTNTFMMEHNGASFATKTMDAAVLTLRQDAGHWFFLNLQYELEDALAEVGGMPLIPFNRLQAAGTRRRWYGRTKMMFPCSIRILFVVAMSSARCWLDRFEGWRKQCGKVGAYLFDAWPVESVLDGAEFDLHIFP